MFLALVHKFLFNMLLQLNIIFNLFIFLSFDISFGDIVGASNLILWAAVSDLSSYPGYFREFPWFSMGPLEISRVTLTGMGWSSSLLCFMSFFAIIMNDQVLVGLTAADNMVLQHQIISIHTADSVNVVIYPYQKTMFSFNENMFRIKKNHIEE